MKETIQLTETIVGKSGYEMKRYSFTEDEWGDIRRTAIQTLQELKGGEYFPWGVRLFELHREKRVSDTTLVSFLRDLGALV